MEFNAAIDHVPISTSTPATLTLHQENARLHASLTSFSLRFVVRTRKFVRIFEKPDTKTNSSEPAVNSEHPRIDIMSIWTASICRRRKFNFFPFDIRRYHCPAPAPGTVEKPKYTIQFDDILLSFVEVAIDAIFVSVQFLTYICDCFWFTSIQAHNMVSLCACHACLPTYLIMRIWFFGSTFANVHGRSNSPRQQLFNVHCATQRCYICVCAFASPSIVYPIPCVVFQSASGTRIP